MNISTFIKKELSGWGKYERMIFPMILGFIMICSLCMKDSKIALISALCGISYTILAGKGKISCYFFGLISTLCYSYLSFKNSFWGNLGLNLLYYFPMQIWGIFCWKKYLKPQTQEIFKTKLNKKEFILYFVLSAAAIVILSIALANFKDTHSIFDSVTTVLSVTGMFLTVKRCIEQWYVWIIVNFVSTLMWVFACLHGSNCFAIVLMWIVYFILAIYFLQKWKKEV